MKTSCFVQCKFVEIRDLSHYEFTGVDYCAIVL